jgi:hypothetical protein
MCTFAVGVGFCLGDELYSYRENADIIVMEGTGVAINEHHILSSAHIFIWRLTHWDQLQASISWFVIHAKL